MHGFIQRLDSGSLKNQNQVVAFVVHLACITTWITISDCNSSEHL
jgi:hypothetical protein